MQGLCWFLCWFLPSCMSFPSPATSSSPRSPSPRTPEPFEYTDAAAIQSDPGLSALWYMSAAAKATTTQQPWGIESPFYSSQGKGEDDNMLQLDELLEQDAYDESVSSGPFAAANLLISSCSSPSPSFASTSAYPSPVPKSSESASHYPPPVHSQPDILSNPLVAPSHSGSISVTKPIPPPASLPRKVDPATMKQRVVYPVKESCYKCVFS
jgi:uncharacterized protein